MTFAGMLGGKQLGIPLIAWILGGGVGFYLLMRWMERGQVVPSAFPAGVDVAGPGSGGAPPEGALPQTFHIYMPQIRMPWIGRNGIFTEFSGNGAEHQGVHY